MTDIITLNWEQTNIEDIEGLGDTDFYAFTQGDALLYIGIAYYQDVIDEIKKTINDFGLKAQELTIWLGYIERSDYERITKQIIRDIECLLIFTNQPMLNTHCKKNYSGRDNLTVLNYGCPYLKTRVKIENDEIYYN